MLPTEEICFIFCTFFLSVYVTHTRPRPGEFRTFLTEFPSTWNNNHRKRFRLFFFEEMQFLDSPFVPSDSSRTFRVENGIAFERHEHLFYFEVCATLKEACAANKHRVMAYRMSANSTGILSVSCVPNSKLCRSSIAGAARCILDIDTSWPLCTLINWSIQRWFSKLRAFAFNLPISAIENRTRIRTHDTRLF